MTSRYTEYWTDIVIFSHTDTDFSICNIKNQWLNTYIDSVFPIFLHMYYIFYEYDLTVRVINNLFLGSSDADYINTHTDPPQIWMDVHCCDPMSIRMDIT